MISFEEPPVWLDPNASEKTKQLWWLHGNPHSKRYANPELTSLSALIRHNASVFGSQTAFLYPSSSSDDPDYIPISWKDFDSLTTRLARIYSDLLEDILVTARASGKQPTIALFGGGFTIEYLATEMALQKLNLRVLLLAPKTPQHAIDHLFKVTDVLSVIADSRHLDLVSSLPVLPMVETLPLEDAVDDQDSLPLAFEDGKDPWERHNFIIHSSGSTGLPKPIKHTNRSLMMIARMYRLFPEFHIENWFLLFPLFHIAGISIILSGFPNGLVSSLPPRNWPPRSSSILQACSKLAKMGHPVECIHCAPMVIESLVDYIEQSTGDFKLLADLKVLQPGGAMLSSNIVSKLVAEGVNVKTTYGSTEIGPPLRSMPHSKRNPECYRLANLYPENEKLKMEPVGDGLYECIIYNGFELAADLWDSPEDTRPYRTNDLFVQSPPNSGYYVLEGRKDDILVHTTGENTNANAIETSLRGSSKLFKKLVVLGHARMSPCLLAEVDNTDAETRQEIEKAVASVNKLYPSHSAILPSLIYLIPNNQTLPVTPKGNVKRKEAEKQYQKEVDDLYATLEGTSSHDNGIPIMLDLPLKEVIRAAVSSISGHLEANISDSASFYELGLDSLAAVRLRSQLTKHIGQITVNTIFENPTVEGLSHWYETKDSTQKSHKPYISKLIETYTAEISAMPPVPPAPAHEAESILLTGTSGSLGTALLEVFSTSPRVKKVFALIHGSNGLGKLKNSMAARQMDFEYVFASGKIEVLTYDMQDPHLGLSEHDYARLADQVTSVVHGAWMLDFNKPVEEYEGSCLNSLMNMLHFCCATRPKALGFVSSIATCLGSSAPTTVLEAPVGDDIDLALPTGYAQSKYIGEKMCQVASQHLGLPIRILRLGQMYGHTRTGAWNPQEMFPIMIATSIELGALPILPPSQSVDWIAVDIAAATMLDIVTSSYAPSFSESNPSLSQPPTYNIVNPVPITWTEYLEEIETAINSEEPPKTFVKISMKDWVARLAATVGHELDGTVPLPGLKLLGFFEEMASHGADDISSSEKNSQATQVNPRVFDTTLTRKKTSALQVCKPVNKDTLRLCVKWWRAQGHLR